MLERKLRDVESRAAKASVRAVTADFELVRMALRELFRRAVDAIVSPSVGPVSVRFSQASTADLFTASLFPSYASSVDGEMLSTAVVPLIFTTPVSSLQTTRDSVARQPAKYDSPRGTMPPKRRFVRSYSFFLLSAC